MEGIPELLKKRSKFDPKLFYRVAPTPTDFIVPNLVLLPSKFLLGYNFEMAKDGIKTVLLPSKFLLGYNLGSGQIRLEIVLLPSKFLLC